MPALTAWWKQRSYTLPQIIGDEITGHAADPAYEDRQPVRYADLIFNDQLVQRRSYLSIMVVGNIPFDLSNGPAF
jgi:hypothetical protein